MRVLKQRSLSGLGDPDRYPSFQHMTVYGCPKCRVILTFRPSESRDREYVFPHSDDYRGCDVCGVKYCENCAAEMGELCPNCSGTLHINRAFPATGKYQLPPFLQKLDSRIERLNALEKIWKRGIIAEGEREHWRHLIEELASDS